MMQYISRLFLTRLSEHAQLLKHSERYQLSEQIIHENALSAKNKLRLHRLRKTKEAKAKEKLDHAHNKIKQKQHVIKFNDLHGLQEELKRMKEEIHTIEQILSKKELNHYKTRIQIFEGIIEKKKEAIRKKQ